MTAATVYKNRNLILRSLRLDQDNQFETINLDTSKIGDQKLQLEAKGEIGGGRVLSRIELAAKGQSFETAAQLQANNVSLGKLGPYLGQAPGRIAGELREAKIDWRGKLDAPKTWNGTVRAALEKVGEEGWSLDQAIVEIEAANGRATIRNARIDQTPTIFSSRGRRCCRQRSQSLGGHRAIFSFRSTRPILRN